MEKEWRLVNENKHLMKEHFIHTTFQPTEECDHVHCAFCWAKFGAERNWLRTGYYTLGKHRWVCEQCFQDFRNQFGWVVDCESV